MYLAQPNAVINYPFLSPHVVLDLLTAEADISGGPQDQLSFCDHHDAVQCFSHQDFNGE